jgi:hypothetical protein
LFLYSRVRNNGHGCNKITDIVSNQYLWKLPVEIAFNERHPAMLLKRLINETTVKHSYSYRVTTYCYTVNVCVYVAVVLLINLTKDLVADASDVEMAVVYFRTPNNNITSQ